MKKKKSILKNGNWLNSLAKFTIISFVVAWLCPALNAQKANRVEFFSGLSLSPQIVDFKKMDAPNTSVRKIKFKDFGNEELGNPFNFGLAYQFGWLNHAAHISFIGEMGWNYWSFITKKMDETEIGHKIHSLKPGASFMYHIGNFTKKGSKVRGLISVGANYNWNFNYKSALTNDNAAIKSGISSIYGIGFEYLNNEVVDVSTSESYYKVDARIYIACLLKYEHSHYNFFNTGYSLNNINVFDGWHSNFGALYLSLIFTFKGKIL